MKLWDIFVEAHFDNKHYVEGTKGAGKALEDLSAQQDRHAERMSKSLARMSSEAKLHTEEMVRHTSRATAIIRDITLAAGGAGAAFVGSAGGGSSFAALRNTVRGAELGGSIARSGFLSGATIGTAGTIGAVMASEAWVRLAEKQGRLIEGQSLYAKQTGQSLAEVQRFAAAEKELGTAAGELEKLFGRQNEALSKGFGADSLGNVKAIVDQFRGLSDPMARADFLVKNFGGNAEQAGAMLNKSLVLATENADALAHSLSQGDLESLQRLVHATDGWRDAWQALGVQAKSSLDGIRVASVQMFAEVERHSQLFIRPGSREVPEFGGMERDADARSRQWEALFFGRGRLRKPGEPEGSEKSDLEFRNDLKKQSENLQKLVKPPGAPGADALEDQLRASYNAQRVNQLQMFLGRQHAALDQANSDLKESERLLAIIDGAYRHGDASAADFAAAQRDVADATERVAQATRDQAIAEDAAFKKRLSSGGVSFDELNDHLSRMRALGASLPGAGGTAGGGGGPFTKMSFNGRDFSSFGSSGITTTGFNGRDLTGNTRPAGQNIIVQIQGGSPFISVQQLTDLIVREVRNATVR